MNGSHLRSDALFNYNPRMPATPQVISFRVPVAPQESTPDADKLLSGQPRLSVWNYYADPANRFFAGVWAATRGSWQVRYTEHEFCHLLAGRVAITSREGARVEFSAGESFVIPAGFVGTWEVLEDCRKLYAIFDEHA